MTISPPDVLLGAQRPRICSVPPAASSAGQEAIALAASAGLNLDPWQQFVLQEALGERADGSWTAFEVGLVVGRQNGKGAVLEARELAGLFLFGEKLILHSAHEFKTAQEAFLRVKALIDNTDQLRRRVARVRTSHGEEGIELSSGARLRFVARSTGSGRGFSGDLVILDEAYNLSAEAIAALLPTLSARPNPQLWYTSSAGMETSAQLHNVRDRGMAGDDPRLAYFEFSADPEGLDLDDREAWAAANPALGIRIREEFVEAERRAMPAAKFARERLGIWPDARVEQVIPRAVWTGLADPFSTIAGPLVFSVDATPERSAASIAVAGRREDELLHGELIEDRPGIGWVVDRIVELVERWSPRAVMLDPSSPAGSLIPALQDRDVEPELVSGRELAQACGAFYDAAVEGQLRHLDQAPLNLALQGAKRRPLGDAWAWHRKDSATNISPLVAITLALHGFAVHGREMVEAVPNLW